MSEYGILRRVGDFGQLFIPKSVREKLDIEDGQYVEIFVRGKEVVIRKSDVSGENKNQLL